MNLRPQFKYFQPPCVMLVSLGVQLCIEIFLWSDSLHAAKIIQNPHLKEKTTFGVTAAPALAQVEVVAFAALEMYRVVVEVYRHNRSVQMQVHRSGSCTWVMLNLAKNQP